ncbi:mechanosensitive ion channel family protein [Pseudanabaenaceae cyanobacterium LEGE 13415]|nr:mechanosensitive ion channel family protein [Pseudanabaenaceae cyanobacterium LEGE 13415]
MVSLIVGIADKGTTQGTSPTITASPTPIAAPQPSNTPSLASDEIFFADVLVRGQPVFQVGSLANLSASDRAQTINRRIASLLSQGEVQEPVTVTLDSQRSVAILKLRNRILMTVTQQDAQDFNLPVEALAQRWAEALNQAFDQPAFAIDVGQRLWTTLREFQRDTISNLPALIGALLALLATWLIAGSLRRLTFIATRRWQGGQDARILISRVVYGAVWVIGSIVALGVVGLDFATLLGTLGLTSVAIAFSLRDILSNYLSGVILLASRPFRIGDQIVIKEFEGTVTQIQLRTTTVVTYDGRTVYIPNQEVFSAVITNNTVSGKRRTSVTIGITYDTDMNTVKKILNDAVLKVTDVEPEPKPLILVRELAATTVQIEVQFWVNSQRLSFVEMTSEAAQAIKEALQQAGIVLVSIPQLKVIQPIERAPDDRPKADAEKPS